MENCYVYVIFSTAYGKEHSYQPEFSLESYISIKKKTSLVDYHMHVRKLTWRGLNVFNRRTSGFHMLEKCYELNFFERKPFLFMVKQGRENSFSQAIKLPGTLLLTKSLGKL